MRSERGRRPAANLALAVSSAMLIIVGLTAVGLHGPAATPSAGSPVAGRPVTGAEPPPTPAGPPPWPAGDRVGAQTPEGRSSAPESPATTPGAGQREKSKSSRPSGAAASVPDRLSVPSLGLSMPVLATGIRRDGQMALPADPRTLGWYRYGPGPGDARGSAVLAGHLDSDRYGIGPLTALASVSVGDRVLVRSDTHSTHYVVTARQQVDKSRFDAAEVFSRSGPPRLRIITCDGRFLAGSGGYQANLIITAEPA